MAKEENILSGVEKKLGYAFNYLADVGAGQQFQITGSFPVDVTEDEIRKEFKKFRNVIEDHRLQSGVKDLEDNVNKAKRQLASLEETLVEMDAAMRDLKNIPSNQKQARAQTLVGIQHWRLELADAEKLLAERKKLLGA